MRRRALLLACLALSACAPLRPRREDGPGHSGRLSLSVRTDPVQTFSAAFDLRGQASQGELLLTSPLGTTLARARWSAGGAELDAGTQRQRFASMDLLLTEVLGTALPLEALFDWLAGRNTAASGWEADLSQHAQGRLLARRLHPLPAVDLRLLLEIQ
jgi:outer membrane lipoprotein LolB